MSKFIVTGGSGFIGSNLVDELVNLGNEVISIDKKTLNENQKANNIKLDICDYESLFPHFKNVDAVFHLAAESRIQPSIKNPLLSVKSNVLGTTNILQCARENQVKKVIYSSTSSAYGTNPIPNREYQDEDCLNPYAFSKVAGEKMCNMYRKVFGLKCVTLRYFNVYGPRSPTEGQYSPVVGLFLNQKKEGKFLTVVGDGSQRRDFVHVKDVVRANLMAYEKEIPSYCEPLFNIGIGKNYSVLEIANMISDKIEFIPERKGEMKETLADPNKAKTFLGWNPIEKLEDYVNSLIS